MTCFHPKQGFLRTVGHGSLKWFPASKKMDAWEDQYSAGVPQCVPCGQCIGCRLKRSRDWSVRCVNEASLWEHNHFITLTYSPEYLPRDMSLDHSHFQKFMKKLRKRKGAGVRYMMCGEYGDRYRRPHFHAILFNCEFTDLKLWSCKRGHRLYSSAELESIWGYGFCPIGSVTHDSAAYVARYITKKITGDAAVEHYARKLEDGSVVQLKPEYSQPSRKGGIGKGWITKYITEVYPSDEVLFKNYPCMPPEFYDKQLQVLDPALYALVKEQRKSDAAKRKEDNSFRRLLDKETCAQARFKKLIRSVEGETL